MSQETQEDIPPPPRLIRNLKLHAPQAKIFYSATLATPRPSKPSLTSLNRPRSPATEDG